MQQAGQSLAVNNQAISRLEVQVGHLASKLNERQLGKLPSQPKPNPRGSNPSGQFQAHTVENPPSISVNAIITLRSGKDVDNKVEMPPPSPSLLGPPVLSIPSIPSTSPTLGEKEKASDSTDGVFIQNPPYPSRLLSNKKTAQLDKILEVFKQVKVNIPLLDVIQQVPSYARFLNDLCTQKWTTNVAKKAFLAAHVSSILSCPTPIKYKDPGCSTIP